MNDRRPTDLELAVALQAHLPAGAPAGLRDRIHEATAAVPQRRPLWSWTQPRPMRTVSPLGWAAILVLLLVALLAVALLVGSLRRDPSPARVLVLANDFGLRTIDLDSGKTTSVLKDTGLTQVVRSPDGALASFWTNHLGVDWLEVIGTDGSDRRRLASSLDIKSGGCIDRWSPDSSQLAVTAVDHATRRERILLAGLDGSAEFISPESEAAYCPRWSPDGSWIAFASGTGGFRSVVIARPDGSGFRNLSGRHGDARPSGQIAWSPDSQFVYYDTDAGGEHPGRGEIYRVGVGGRGTDATPVKLGDGDAAEPSPDGSWLAFDSEDATGVVDVWIARADGSDATILLHNAILAGWTPDSDLLLAESHDQSDGPNGGLVAVHPDGSERRTVMAFDEPCLPYQCLIHLGWSKPRQY
jgi:hypothetical protein